MKAAAYSVSQWEKDIGEDTHDFHFDGNISKRDPRHSYNIGREGQKKANNRHVVEAYKIVIERASQSSCALSSVFASDLHSPRVSLYILPRITKTPVAYCSLRTSFVNERIWTYNSPSSGVAL